MDISDELCRPDFFDLVPMGLDPKFGDSTSGLMPVTLIDSTDYAMTDGNNNLGSTTGHIKSFIDEMFLTDPMNGDGQNIATLTNSTFEVLGTFQWAGDVTPGATSAHSSGDDDGSSPGGGGGDPNGWFLNPNYTGDGEVTTLTNLIDPLFVTYDDDQGSGLVPTKIEHPSLGESRVVSSDLISSTFINEPPTSDSPTDVSQSSSEGDVITWQKGSEVVVGTGNNPTNGIIYSDDSLLRSALQSGNNNIVNNHTTSSGTSNNTSTTTSTTKIVKLTAVVTSPGHPPSSEMTELRKVLSFPPLTSPTSSTSDHHQSLGSGPAYYELKVIDPIFGDDPNIPNVEELIMTRIDPPFGGYQPGSNNNHGKGQKKKGGGGGGEISERKINSTTLSTKWTYTTNNNNEPGKTPRRRKKNGKKQIGAVNENGLGSNGEPFSPSSNKNGSNNNGSSPNRSQLPGGGGTGGNNGNAPNGTTGVRKERSLHYCNICCKGFKDKYSVNVHVRTHTGEKPFSCNLCGKNFRQKAHLAKHYQTHAAKANNQQSKHNTKR